MLKRRDLLEVPTLFQLLSDPDVFPFVRDKPENLDAYYFLTKQTIEAENNETVISRTILDEFEQPIGTINLYDIQHNYGFLATWVGKPYFGKGYNKAAKEMFLNELFLKTSSIEYVFMKIRNSNTRSLKAALKMPYVAKANDLFPEIYKQVNQNGIIYDLFVISKTMYTEYITFTQQAPGVPNDEEAS